MVIPAGIVQAAVNPNEPTFTQTGNGDDTGQQYGGANDVLGFFGATPITQPKGSGLLSGAIGTVTIYGTNQSPSAVAANTAAEQALTVTGVATGQLVALTKPTSQAGLLVGTARVSATNTVQLTFGNDTGSSITPTATELYETVAIPASMVTSLPISPAAVPANSISEQVFAFAGAHVGNIALVNKPTAQAGLIITGVRVVSEGNIGITYQNLTGSSITPTASEAYLVYVGAGIMIAPIQTTQTITITPNSVAANTTAEQTFAVPGLIAGTPVQVNGVGPAVPGVGIAMARVSAANTLAISFYNNTGSAATPPAGNYVVANYYSAPANSASVAYNAQLGSPAGSTLVALGLRAAN